MDEKRLLKAAAFCDCGHGNFKTDNANIYSQVLSGSGFKHWTLIQR